MSDGFDIGPDIEAQADEFEAQQEFLREQAALDDQWRRELAGSDEPGEDEMHPLDGVMLDGKQVFEVLRTGELVTSDGKTVNSCDALRIIDGVAEQMEDEQ